MNVFILNSGRCGSTTFSKACQHIMNYSSGHESRLRITGAGRLNYPDNHIEADNRLSWFLGRLDLIYGDNAFYVHLLRDKQPAINSFIKRADFGIMKAYREGIYLGKSASDPAVMAADYLDTIETNIQLFLKDKSRQMTFRLENARTDFITFWKLIDAEGDMEKALKEWDITHNQS